MYEKAGKFYADWRDQDGTRLRKSFTSRRAALQFEAEQKELAHPKQKARGQQSPRSYAPKRNGETTRAQGGPPAPSSRKLVHFPRAASAPHTSPKSTSTSGRAATLTPQKPRTRQR
jgi:hypothetical protein